MQTAIQMLMPSSNTLLAEKGKPTNEFCGRWQWVEIKRSEDFRPFVLQMPYF
jgi:hypothetical protein